MTASARPQPHLIPDRLDATGVGDDADDRCLPDGAGGQLRQNRSRVLMAGDTSTLFNVLLGRDVLPTGVLPVTALATTVRGGGPEGMVLRSTDGRVGQHDVHNLAKYLTQTADPGNRLGIAEVVPQLHTPLLADGVELVDTSGTGSVQGQNTDEALASVCTMDTAIFVLTADPPVSAAEQELLRLVAQASVQHLRRAEQGQPAGPRRPARDNAPCHSRGRPGARRRRVGVCVCRPGGSAAGWTSWRCHSAPTSRSRSAGTWTC
ncbi:dynamin family protein [Actinacidiphila oryziradicis]|uniref:Dynamin N-terminal domain-containing protein n=1 Tax=Actinacidiphila oryziradicis TaxID=2571141 RepID=A0A4U0RF63_9ACTN|nr:dynamin family protein [Actinacidiphila oryziradicis]TJZ93666.1 hypothetical protein FCI23_54210 [Actinacidiphila oryziradicis]